MGGGGALSLSKRADSKKKLPLPQLYWGGFGVGGASGGGVYFEGGGGAPLAPAVDLPQSRTLMVSVSEYFRFYKKSFCVSTKHCYVKLQPFQKLLCVSEEKSKKKSYQSNLLKSR